MTQREVAKFFHTPPPAFAGVARGVAIVMFLGACSEGEWHGREGGGYIKVNRDGIMYTGIKSEVEPKVTAFAFLN
jgi:hypothetical protein